MDSLDIDIFLQIIKDESIQKAAQSLFLAPSTIGQRLKALESELGILLFERSKGIKQTVLTEKGKEFEAIASDLKHHFSKALLLKNKNNYPQIIIASADSFIGNAFAPLYRQLVFEKPHFKINLQCYRADMIYSYVENKSVDIGFTLYEVENSNILVKPIFSDDLVVVTSKEYPLYGNEIHTSHLDPEKELSIGKNDEKYLGWGPLYKMWHDKWFDPNIVPIVIGSSVTWLTHFFAGTDFWAIVPRSIALRKQNEHELKIFNLKNPPPKRICYQLVNKQQTTSSQNYISLFNQHLEIYLAQWHKSGLIEKL